MSPILRQRIAAVALLAAVAIWGINFVVVRAALSSYPLAGFLFLRFLIGGGALLGIALLRPSSRPIRSEFPGRQVLVIGLVLAASYLTQTWGLALGASPAVAAMLTSLVVVLTPAWEWVVCGLAPDRRVAITAVLVIAGTALVSQGASAAGAGAHPQAIWGLALEVVSAAAFSLQVVLVGRIGRSVSPTFLGAAQLLVVAAVLLPVVPFAGGLPTPGLGAVLAILFCALGASAFGFAVQAAAQHHLSPESTAVIMATEPAFALLASAIAGEQALEVASWIGLSLLLLGTGVQLPSDVARQAFRHIQALGAQARLARRGAG